MAIANRVTADPDAPFTLASLVGDAGVGANGEKLVQTLAHYYPPELEAATLKRVNQPLTDGLDEDAIASIAKVAGAPEDSDLNVKVRGGELRASDAVVLYAFHDDSGQLWKGCFPYSQLGKSDPDGHVSQRESLAGSPAAEDYEKARAKARAAAGDDGSSAEAESLRAEVESLREQLEGAGKDPEPVKDYADANARDIATMLSAADRATAARVHEYEAAHDDRSTVIQAAEKRIAALDAEDQAATEAAAQKDAELETLRARVAELEAPQGSDSTSGS